MFNTLHVKTSFLPCLFLSVSTLTVFVGELQAGNHKKGSNDITTRFVTPSGNIHCALIGGAPPALRCEIRSMLRPLPSQPYAGYCKFDWGAGFLLSQQGQPKVLCISDTIGAADNQVLYYGSTWRHSGFKCLSKKNGLRCNNSHGKGFLLNRYRWYTF
jgi:hypothetical protein